MNLPISFSVTHTLLTPVVSLYSTAITVLQYSMLLLYSPLMQIFWSGYKPSSFLLFSVAARFLEYAGSYQFFEFGETEIHALGSLESQHIVYLGFSPIVPW